MSEHKGGHIDSGSDSRHQIEAAIRAKETILHDPETMKDLNLNPDDLRAEIEDMRNRLEGGDLEETFDRREKVEEDQGISDEEFDASVQKALAQLKTEFHSAASAKERKLLLKDIRSIIDGLRAGHKDYNDLTAEQRERVARMYTDLENDLSVYEKSEKSFEVTEQDVKDALDMLEREGASKGDKPFVTIALVGRRLKKGNEHAKAIFNELAKRGIISEVPGKRPWRLNRDVKPEDALAKEVDKKTGVSLEYAAEDRAIADRYRKEFKTANDSDKANILKTLEERLSSFRHELTLDSADRRSKRSDAEVKHTMSQIGELVQELRGESKKEEADSTDEREENGSRDFAREARDRKAAFKKADEFGKRVIINKLKRSVADVSDATLSELGVDYDGKESLLKSLREEIQSFESKMPDWEQADARYFDGAESSVFDWRNNEPSSTLFVLLQARKLYDECRQALANPDSDFEKGKSEDEIRYQLKMSKSLLDRGLSKSKQEVEKAVSKSSHKYREENGYSREKLKRFVEAYAELGDFSHPLNPAVEQELFPHPGEIAVPDFSIAEAKKEEPTAWPENEKEEKRLRDLLAIDFSPEVKRSVLEQIQRYIRETDAEIAKESNASDELYLDRLRDHKVRLQGILNDFSDLLPEEEPEPEIEDLEDGPEFLDEDETIEDETEEIERDHVQGAIDALANRFKAFGEGTTAEEIGDLVSDIDDLRTDLEGARDPESPFRDGMTDEDIDAYLAQINDLMDQMAKGWKAPTPEPAPMATSAPAVESKPSIDIGAISPELAKGESLPASPGFIARMYGSVAKSVGDIYRREVKGEVLPEENEAGAMTKAAWAQAAAKGLLAGAGSMLGLKAFVDVPRYLSQMYFTSAEKEELLRAVGVKDEKEKLPVEISRDLGVRFIAAEKRIRASKFLTEAKKEDLLDRLQKVMSDHEAQIVDSETKRDQRIAELINLFVETRVKGTTATKEVVNTTLVAASLATWGLGTPVLHKGVRSAAYAGISAYERYQTVAKEMALGERTESWAKEYFGGAFTETWNNLQGGKAETKLGKAANVAKGVGTLVRAAGLGAMAFRTEGEMVQAVIDHFSGNAEHGQQIAGEVIEKVSAAEVPDYPALHGQIIPKNPELSKIADRMLETSGATIEAPEISHAAIELGTVHAGNGMVEVIARQIEADPAKFGFEGAPGTAHSWAVDQAIKMAKGSSIIDQGYEMRLTDQAREHLAIVVEADGLHYVDPSTGAEVSPQQLQEMTYVFPTGAAPAPSEVDLSPRGSRVLSEDLLSRSAPTEVEHPAANIEVITSSSGLGQDVMFDRGGVHFNLTQDGKIESLNFKNIQSNPERVRSIAASISAGETAIPSGDRQLVAKTIDEYMYVLDQYEKAGMKDSDQYKFVLADMRSLVAKAKSEMTIDESSGVFKGRLNGVVATEATQNLAQAQHGEFTNQAARHATERGRTGNTRSVIPESEYQRLREQAVAQEIIGQNGTFYVAPFGAVHFDYDQNGNVIGWDKDMRFGLRARAEAAGIVSPGTGPVGQEPNLDQLQREVITRPSGEIQGGRIIMPERAPLPTHQLRARKEISLEVYAIGQTDEALEKAGYKATSPERLYLHQQLLDLMERVNTEWKGRLKLDPANPKFRQYL